MAIHHPTKFDDQRHGDSGDIKILVVKEEDFICLLKSAFAIFL